MGKPVACRPSPLVRVGKSASLSQRVVPANEPVKKYGPHPEELAKQASRRMDAPPGLAAILRDARKGALLRMRSEIYSQPRTPGPIHRALSLNKRVRRLPATTNPCGYRSRRSAGTTIFVSPATSRNQVLCGRGFASL